MLRYAQNTVTSRQQHANATFKCEKGPGYIIIGPGTHYTDRFAAQNRCFIAHNATSSLNQTQSAVTQFMAALCGCTRRQQLPQNLKCTVTQCHTHTHCDSAILELHPSMRSCPAVIPRQRAPQPVTHDNQCHVNESYIGVCTCQCHIVFKNVAGF